MRCQRILRICNSTSVGCRDIERATLPSCQNPVTKEFARSGQCSEFVRHVNAASGILIFGRTRECNSGSIGQDETRFAIAGGIGRPLPQRGVPRYNFSWAAPSLMNIADRQLIVRSGGRRKGIVYDDQQHRDRFNGPGQYLFRGTLPSSAFVTPYEGLGVTPTSIDPVVATLFACRYLMDGPAAVFLALKSDFAGLLDGPSLASFDYEFAVNIELPPDEFEKLCRYRVAVNDSIAVLCDLGYRLPSRLPDLGALTQALIQSRKMNMEDIDRYVKRCQQLQKGG